MEGGVRARSESEGSNCSGVNLESNYRQSSDSKSDSRKCKHVEFEDTQEHQSRGAGRSKDKLSRSRRARSLYGVSPNCRFGPKGSLLDTTGTVLTIPDPGSQKLNWRKPPLTVLVVKKVYDESILDPFRDVISWLIEVRKMIVYVEASVMQDGILALDTTFQQHKDKLQTFNKGTCKDDLTDKIDFIICLGGDGTLLHASTLFQQSCPPVMAFHQGSLGFLTPFRFENFQDQITQVLEGNASLLLRYRLKCLIMKEDSECGKVHIKHLKPTSMTGKQILVLNEVVVDRGMSSFLSNVDLYIEGRYATTVQGDGLIISTPTGSTAYAVAAGASMIHPNVPAIMITPICPHSLSFRPIVVPAGVEVKIMLSPQSRNSAMVSFDGRDRQEISQGDCVRITTAEYPLPSVCAKDQIDDWFDRLAECLHWNVRKPQKELSYSSASSVENSFTDLNINGQSNI